MTLGAWTTQNGLLGRKTHQHDAPNRMSESKQDTYPSRETRYVNEPSVQGRTGHVQVEGGGVLRVGVDELHGKGDFVTMRNLVDAIDQQHSVHLE